MAISLKVFEKSGGGGGGKPVGEGSRWGRESGRESEMWKSSFVCLSTSCIAYSRSGALHANGSWLRYPVMHWEQAGIGDWEGWPSSSTAAPLPRARQRASCCCCCCFWWSGAERSRSKRHAGRFPGKLEPGACCCCSWKRGKCALCL